MESAGLPIGDLPDGSPNQAMKAFFLNGEARDEERMDNEKVKISIMAGQVITPIGPGLIKPGTTGDGGCF